MTAGTEWLIHNELATGTERRNARLVRPADRPHDRVPVIQPTFAFRSEGFSPKRHSRAGQSTRVRKETNM